MCHVKSSCNRTDPAKSEGKRVTVLSKHANDDMCPQVKPMQFLCIYQIKWSRIILLFWTRTCAFLSHPVFSVWSIRNGGAFADRSLSAREALTGAVAKSRTAESQTTRQHADVSQSRNAQNPLTPVRSSWPQKHLRTQRTVERQKKGGQRSQSRKMNRVICVCERSSSS